jgi:hypothetical protein
MPRTGCIHCHNTVEITTKSLTNHFTPIFTVVYLIKTHKIYFGLATLEGLPVSPFSKSLMFFSAAQGRSRTSRVSAKEMPYAIKSEMRSGSARPREVPLYMLEYVLKRLLDRFDQWAYLLVWISLPVCLSQFFSKAHFIRDLMESTARCFSLFILDGETLSKKYTPFLWAFLSILAYFYPLAFTVFFLSLPFTHNSASLSNDKPTTMLLDRRLTLTPKY